MTILKELNVVKNINIFNKKVNLKYEFSNQSTTKNQFF